jgi:NADH-quinone oxidoreductase subunit C
MTPDEVGARLVTLVPGAEATETYGESTVDVPAAAWVDAARAARDDEGLDLSYFDWLSGVDELDEGFGIVAHLWSVRLRHRVLLRTRVPRSSPVLASLTPLFAGAAWHERETYEMFGVAFAGHPDLKPLLLPDGFDGQPLRKDFVLASRVAKEWPGAREPGESHTGATRRRMRPPGVPDPGEWGPEVWAAGAEAGAEADGAAPGAEPDGA